MHETLSTDETLSSEVMTFHGPSQDFYPPADKVVNIECVSGTGFVYIGDDNEFPLGPGSQYGQITIGNGWRVVPGGEEPLVIQVNTKDI